MSLSTKKCNQCKKIKPISEFHKNKTRKSGVQFFCRVCAKLNQAARRATPIGRAKMLLLDVKKQIKGKRAALEKTLKLEDILPAIESGKCQLTGLPFDLNRPKTTFQNPYAPSIDRIDSAKGYTKENVRVVLYAVNSALGENSDEEMLPILKAMVKAIEKNATTKSATSVSTGLDQQSQSNSQSGPVLTTGTGQNCDDANDYRRTTQGENAYHSAKEGSGNSLAYGSLQVATLETFNRIENNGEPECEIIRLDFSRRHLSD